MGTKGVVFPILSEDLEIGVDRFLEVLVVLLPYSCSLASNNSKNSPNALDAGTLAGGFAGALVSET